MIKTYQLINDINLTTPVLCDGKARMISFTGGMKNSGETIRHGSFTTSDGKMQKALEADSGFNKVFYCTLPDTHESMFVSTDAPNPSGTGNNPVEWMEVPNITNKQDAIEWLAANKGIEDLKPTCRIEAVRNAAALSGVFFPDWK